MEKRRLGKSDLEVSVVGLGCNNFGWGLDLEGTRRVVDAAVAHGINFFDTADVYGNKGGSEEMLGKILGDRRKDIVLATKFGMPMDSERKGASRKYMLAAIEDSLRRLKTSWIDLYQVHQPDPATPIEETMRALDDLVKQGKVRQIGCSNYKSWQMVDAQWTARHDGHTQFVSCQDEYSLLVRDVERELLPAVRAYGMGFLPFFPLASGLLTGKYRRDAMPPESRLTDIQRLADRYLTESNWKKTGELAAFCKVRGRTLLELAFSWLAGQPNVMSVIAGATKAEQIEQNVRAAGWALTPEEMVEVDRITK